MTQRLIRTVRQLVVGPVLLLLAACSGDGRTAPSDPQLLTLQALSANVVVVPTYDKRLRVRVVNDKGQGVVDARVRFEAAAGFVEEAEVLTGRDGIAAVKWNSPDEVGGFTVSARIQDPGPLVSGSSISIAASVRSFGASTDDVLRGVPFLVARALEDNVAAKPFNPALADEFDRKITLLSRPDLDSEIIAQGRFLSHAASTLDGGELPIDLVFAGPDMRAGAERAFSLIPSATARLEQFFSESFPAGRILMWYGFQLGSSGGGGSLYLEDRETYERRGNGALPYDAIVVHELAHSYVAHESMTQFLELLLLNVERHGTTSIASWTHTRGYTGPSSTNTGVHALVEIYQLIGFDAMAQAYRNVEQSDALYGRSLAPAAQQAFVDAAPAAMRASVAEAVARVGV